MLIMATSPEADRTTLGATDPESQTFRTLSHLDGAPGVSGQAQALARPAARARATIRRARPTCGASTMDPL